MTFGTRGCSARIITFSVHEPMLMKTMLNPTIKLSVLAVGIGSVFGASLLGAEEDKSATAADRISLFTVPLRCQAAPDFGSGPLSKPITPPFPVLALRPHSFQSPKKPSYLTLS